MTASSLIETTCGTTAAMASGIGLDPRQRRALREDGFVVLRNVIEPTAVIGMRAAFARVCERMLDELLRDGLIGDTRPDLPLETRLSVAAGAHAARFGRSWRKDVASAELFALHRSPRLIDALADWFSDGVMGHPVYNARPKLPRQQLTVVPWHQDSAYFGPDSARQHIATAWLPLVPVDATNGCMQVAAGSHRYGLMPHHVESAEGGFLELTGADPREDVIVTCAMAPGDALLFDNLTWHRSLPNLSDGIRWSIDLRFYPERLSGTIPNGEFPEPWAIRASRPETDETTWLRWATGMTW